MIPMRQHHVTVVDRVYRQPLGTPVSLSITEDEEWSPRIQAELTVPDSLRTAMQRPGGDIALGKLQGDIVTLDVQTWYGPGLSCADLTASRAPGQTWTEALGSDVAAITRAHSTQWNLEEWIEPLQEATLKWGGSVANVTAALAPGVTLSELTAALVAPDGIHNPQPADRLMLQLATRSITPNGDGTTTYRLASVDVRLHDYRRIDPTTHTSVSTTLRSLVAWAIGTVNATAMYGAEIKLKPGFNVAISPGYVWKPGQTAWEFLRPALEDAGWTLYADASMYLRLEVRVPQAATVTLDPARNLLSLDPETYSSEDYFDSAILEYTDADPNYPAQRFDVYAPSATRVAHVTLPGVRRGNGAAQRYVERALERGTRATAEALVLLPLHAGDRVPIYMGVKYAQGNYIRDYRHGTLQSITHRFPEGESTIRLRDYA